MPIQPLNVSSGQYNQIPDAEDVTPLGNSVAKKFKRSFKAIALAIGCSAIVVTIMVLAVKIAASKLRSPLRVFQTSMGQGDRIKLLSAGDFTTRGYPIEALEFGNVKCSKDSDDNDVCSSTTTNPSTLFVDATKKFQKIVGFGGAFTEAAAYNFYKLPPAVQSKVKSSDHNIKFVP